jgi:hypothetical protein
MRDFVKKVNDALKYKDESTVQNLVGQMKLADWIGEHTDADHSKRGVLADAYEEHTGDTDGANLLRTPDRTVAFHEGRMVPGVVLHRNAGFSQTGNEDEVGEILDRDGPQEAMQHALENYDTGEGRLTDTIPYGSADQKVRTEDGYHTFAWNRNMGYWSLTEHRVLPETEKHRAYYNNG